MAFPDPVLDQLIDILAKEDDRIPDSRITVLDKLASYINQELKSGEPVRLNFICTHNSRRSQMAQIWAYTAATQYQVPRFEAYSGGTEITYFHPNAVQAMRTLGFRFLLQRDHQNPTNPHYEVVIGTGIPPLICYSKQFEDAIPSGKAFTAIITCSEAEKNCPVVPGAKSRFPLTYEDPKKNDGTSQEEKGYLKTAVEIGRELIYVFRNV